MVDGFPQLPLGKIVADVIDNRGRTPPWGENEAIELIETASIVGDNKYPDYSLVQKRVSQETYDHWFRGHPRAKDILIATVGANIGNLSIMKENRGCVAQNLVCLRVDTKQADQDFVYYFLTWEPTQVSLKNLDIGAAQPSIKVPHLLNTKISIPPFPEQRTIAGILGALDDKIELNHRMNATLETMARAVFRQWFVRNVDIENWEIKILGDVLSVLETGSRPKGGVFHEPIGIPSVGAESIVKLGYFDFSKTKYVSVEFYESMRRGHIEDRDVLLYKDGGRPGEFEPHVSMFGNGFPFEKFSINEHVYRIRVAPPFSQAYFYFWLESDEIMEEMRNRGTGVAIPGLNSTALSNISISIPPEKLLNDFTNYAEPLISKIFANARESRTLASLRDALLPKLMRGEIRVKLNKEVNHG